MRLRRNEVLEYAAECELPILREREAETVAELPFEVVFDRPARRCLPLRADVDDIVIQGPRGGGGSNFTGSWSATGHGACP